MLHLVSAQGKEGDMLFEVFNSGYFRLRFYPCMKEADYPGGNDRYIVFHAPKDSLRFKPAGGMDDYHIAWRSASRYIIPVRFLWK